MKGYKIVHVVCCANSTENEEYIVWAHSEKKKDDLKKQIEYIMCELPSFFCEDKFVYREFVF